MADEKTTTSSEVKLDDANRVQVLSPGMMVAKRFFRNKLAIVGLVIIVFMFLFSFLGGYIIPYSESQVFYTSEEMKKDYAGATKISDLQLFTDSSAELPSDINSKLILAIGKGEATVETRDGSIFDLTEIAADTYTLSQNGVDIAMACKLQVSAVDANTKLDFDFYHELLVAMASDATEITVAGTTYTISEHKGGAVVSTADGSTYAFVSSYIINPTESGTFLSFDFREACIDAIAAGEDSFTITGDEGQEEYLISNKDGQCTIQRYEFTRVIDSYASPSKEHLMGTDANGMDLLARLMYGGRISLLIGFVVVVIELVLGVVVGGVAGYFGGWVDTILMRVVDVIYCIPSMPLYLIIGSIMDFYKASSTTRIYALCIIMGAIGWVGIARIVRGQILSLREQEFMIATEATGIRVSRRIFKHLIPNVIPQLVVFASMGIGEVILAESSLSFLGLGIKYPSASWGSIINAVNDSYVMTNYLFVWVPAGLLILLTVLAFNFIGDGLRDAFDPKMKR